MSLLAEESNTTQDASVIENTSDEVELTWHLSVAHHDRPDLIGLHKVVPSGASLELGRHAGCLGEGVFDHASISRRHTRITAFGNELRVEDLGSRNGTTVHRTILKCSDMSLTSRGIIGIGPVLLVAYRAPVSYRIPDHPHLVGKSYALSVLLDRIHKVAPFLTTVLVSGESGSGKELVARAIHTESRRSGHFCAVNCGTLGGDILQSQIFGHTRGAFTGADRNQMGLLEASHQGTLFLDEIGDAGLSFQVSLLRFLEDREVRPVGDTTSRRIDTRIVAASHHDLRWLICKGLFREDLYSRLESWVIRVPSLRERIEDIPCLATHFVQKLVGRAQPIDQRLMMALLLYAWPRNVRELNKVIERAVIEAHDQPCIGLSPSMEADLRNVTEPRPGTDETLGSSSLKSNKTKASNCAKPTREQLISMLAEHHGNVRNLATSMGVSRNTLYRWIHEYAIQVEDHRFDRGPNTKLSEKSKSPSW